MYRKALIFILIQALGFFVVYEIKISRVSFYLDKLTLDVSHSTTSLLKNAKQTASYIKEQFLKDGACVYSLEYINTRNILENYNYDDVQYCFEKYYITPKKITKISDVIVTKDGKRIFNMKEKPEQDETIFNGLNIKNSIEINGTQIAQIQTIFDLHYLIDGVQLGAKSDSFFICKMGNDTLSYEGYTSVSLLNGYLIKNDFINQFKNLDRYLSYSNKKSIYSFFEQKSKDLFFVKQTIEGELNVIYFLPMLDSVGEIEAYWIIRITDVTLENLEQDFEIFFILVFLGLTIIMIYIDKEIATRGQVKEKLDFKNEIISSANSGIGIINKKGDFIEVNEYYSSLLGYSQSEFLDMNCIMLAIESGKETAKRTLAYADKHGKIKNVYQQCRSKSGEYIHVEISLKKIGEDRFVAVLNSLEESYKLKESLERFELIFNTTSLGFITIDNNNCIINVNNKLSSMLGYNKKELIGLNVETLFLSEEEYRSFITIKSQTNEHIVKETRLKNKNNQTIWAEISFDKSVNNIDEIKYVWAIKNIDEVVKQRAIVNQKTQELQETLHITKQLIEVNPIPIFLKDQNFIYIDCNDAFCKFMGKSREEIIGKNVFELVRKDLAQKFTHMDTIMTGVSKQFFKSEFQTHNGEVKMVEYHKRAIYKNGHFDGLLGVIIDVSQHETLEKELRESISKEIQKNLEQQILHENNLVKNAKFSAIGQLAAGITHELNTPLTYIKANFEMLKMDIDDVDDGKLKESMREELDEIFDGINRLANIVDGMREMASGSSETIEKFNIYSTLITALRLAYNKSKHVVKIKINGDIFDMGLDRETYVINAMIQKQRLEQVWIIIINNALDELVKIERFEERILEIWIAESPDEVCIFFKDNAGGIPFYLIDDIFEPFMSTKTSSGMGVGLNIAKKIVEEQHGEISVQNIDGGAEFKVVLPKGEMSE